MVLVSFPPCSGNELVWKGILEERCRRDGDRDRVYSTMGTVLHLLSQQEMGSNAPGMGSYGMVVVK